jgi:hypothetical protein
VRLMAFQLTSLERRASERSRQQQAQADTTGFVRLRRRNGQVSMEYFVACSVWGAPAGILAVFGLVFVPVWASGDPAFHVQPASITLLPSRLVVGSTSDGCELTA